MDIVFPSGAALAWLVVAALVAGLARGFSGFGAGLIFPLMQTLAVRAAGGRVGSRLMAAGLKLTSSCT